MNEENKIQKTTKKAWSIGSVICRALMVSSLPEPFRKMAIKSEQINHLINESYNRLKSRVGKEKADELMTQFKNEAFAGREVNHQYIIRQMNSHGI